MRPTSLRFVEFDSFFALAGEKRTLESLIELYRMIFGDPAGWAETYTRDEVMAKLCAELSGHACVRACVRDNGEVVAFCWAQALDLDGILRAIRTIKFYEDIGKPDLRDALHEVVGDGRVLYVHDLAITPKARGRVSLTELVYPALCNVAYRAGVRKVLFWSIADTMMSLLAKRARFEQRLSTHGMQFHVGEFSTRCTLWWHQPTSRPPSTGRTMPVTNAASSEAR